MTSDEHEKPTDPLSLTLESWSQGLMIGSLLIMSAITVVNMRKGVVLHKLIVIELLLAMPDCFFIFFEAPTFGWYLSSTSTLMMLSWILHNVIAWMKNKPFLGSKTKYAYIGTIALVQPYWVLEIYANFVYFNNINLDLFPKTRPFEALCRDPWWIFTTVNLFWNIKYRYDFSYYELVTVSPRFGIMLFSMCLSVVFIIVDILAVTPVLRLGGLNPFWKIAFVFKCLTDTIVLDDFKTALDQLSRHKFGKLGGGVASGAHAQGSQWQPQLKVGTADIESQSSKGGAIHLETRFEVVTMNAKNNPTASLRSTSSTGPIISD